ncbi:hypothetical protein [Cereibacter sphaeroides]|uniref:hypothetical protein n=1 Tax=Cereibacter sphaeroides TaxID=1063 RepID=UPI003FCD49E7
MIPAFRLTVDGEDATGAVADRLLSLVLTDEDGTKADRLEIELDDRDGRLAFPDTEARIGKWPAPTEWSGFNLSA